jgi:hypothetical protein
MSTLFIVVIVIGSFACFLMQSAYLLWCAQILPTIQTLLEKY